MDDSFQAQQRNFPQLFQRGTDFLRVSKSAIVNLSKVRKLVPSISGRFEAVLKNGETVVISRQYVPLLKKHFGL